MNRSVLKMELRRGAAPLLTIALLLVGVGLQLGRLPAVTHYNSWSTGWGAVANYLNGVTIILGPIAGTVAAWVGGRERRLKVSELLAVTARPVWRRHTTTLAAVGIGTLAGFVLVALFAAAGAGPTAAFYRGDWGWAIVLSALGVLTCAAWGWAAGRVVPFRLIAPLVGIVLYVGNGVMAYLSGTWHQLAPVANLEFYDYARFLPAVVPLLVIWLLALTGAAVVPVMARRRGWVAVPLTAAVLSGAFLTQIDSRESTWPSWTRADPQALQQVCTKDAPVVCVTKAHSGMLRQVTPVARDLLASVQPLTGLTRVQEVSRENPDPDALPLADLSTSGLMFSRGLWNVDDIRGQTIAGLTALTCDPGDLPDSSTDDTIWRAPAFAAALLLPQEPAAVATTFGLPDPADASKVTALRADPVAARTWMDHYRAAAAACDLPALHQLLGT